MKTNIRRIIAIISVISLMMTFIPATAGAAGVGDVIGYAKPTNIAAVINGYQLESYNVNGNAYIVVEDLYYYGFNVVYNDSMRALYVERNIMDYDINPPAEKPGYYDVDTTSSNRKILHTDIKTYFSSEEVPSYNIDGKTIIQFDYLQKYGVVSYNENVREISLMLGDLNVNPLYTFMTLGGIATSETQKFNGIDAKMVIRAKGNRMVLDGTFKYNLSDNDKRIVRKDMQELDLLASPQWQQLFDIMKQNLDFGGLDYIFRGADNAIVAYRFFPA